TISLVIVFSSSEDNLFNRLILSRLEVKDGSIVGDNRTNEIFDRNFSEYIASSESMTGIGSVEYAKYEWKNAAAGYKVFLFKYGFLGLLLILLFLLSIIRIYKLNYFSVVL